MENIIKSLYEDESKFNKEAIILARQNKGKINDYLLKEIEKINQDINNKKIEYAPMFLDYAIFLLAEFKEKRLYPLLMELLNKPNIESFNFFGMSVMDKLPSIVASTFNGNLELLNKVIENKEVDEYTREMLIRSYIYFYDYDIITKEDLEKYLKKLIKLYQYEYDGIHNNIVDVIIHAKLFNMIEDVRMMFSNCLVDVRYRGDYDSFIDALFDYQKEEKNDEVDDTVKEMTRFDRFDQKDKTNNLNEAIKKISKKKNEDLDNNMDLYNKVGRNDPCPCGSGKKYKKCCIDKKKEILPYQSYIDKSLNEYPKKNNNKDEVDFYSYYKQEYIEIDKMLYKALKDKFIPMFIKRDIRAEETVELKILNEAFELIKEVLNNNNFKNIDEYDKTISIHYSLYEFFEKYSQLLVDRIQIGEEKHLEKLEELLDVFYQNFDLNNQNDVIFLDRKNAFYILSKRKKEGIQFFEDKLKTSKNNRLDIYGYLFDEYMMSYDYNKAKSKIEEVISKEKDKKLVTQLEELKLEFLDDESEY